MDPLVVASNEFGLEVNADNTTYMVISGDQSAGRNHGIKIVIKSFEAVEQVKYWRTN